MVILCFSETLRDAHKFSKIVIKFIDLAGVPQTPIKRVVIETTGVCANNIARGVMTLCCDVMLCYITTLHLL